jgi:hypothetical protein
VRLPPPLLELCSLSGISWSRASVDHRDTSDPYTLVVWRSADPAERGMAFTLTSQQTTHNGSTAAHGGFESAQSRPPRTTPQATRHTRKAQIAVHSSCRCMRVHGSCLPTTKKAVRSAAALAGVFRPRAIDGYFRYNAQTASKHANASQLDAIGCASLQGAQWYACQQQQGRFG